MYFGLPRPRQFRCLRASLAELGYGSLPATVSENDALVRFCGWQPLLSQAPRFIGEKLTRHSRFLSLCFMLSPPIELLPFPRLIHPSRVRFWQFQGLADRENTLLFRMPICKMSFPGSPRQFAFRHDSLIQIGRGPHVLSAIGQNSVLHQPAHLP